MCKEALINLLLDTLKIPDETVQELVPKADLDGDGYISVKEFYEQYRKWKHGE